MEGGRFLGAGTYGCVFTPPLLCTSGKQQRVGKVGKITMDILADQEIHIGSRIRKIPLAKHYFLLPEPESCKLAPEEQQTDPGLQQCHEYYQRHDEDIEIEEMTQIYEPFGGAKTLYRFIDDKGLRSKQFSFFKTMTHILEAGSVLLLAGVCHFDLHPGNFMVDKDNHIRILDYGNAFAANEFNEATLDMRWKRLRFGFESDAAHPSILNSEAPELTVMNAIHRNEYSVENAIKLTIMGKPIFKDLQKYLGLSPESARKGLEMFFKTSELAKQRHFVKLWKTYWPGYDGWSIAAILLDMYKELLFYSPFMTGEYKSKGAAIKACLRGLLDPNPRDRLDCMEALALVDPGNPWIARFGQRWLAARKQQRQP